MRKSIRVELVDLFINRGASPYLLAIGQKVLKFCDCAGESQIHPGFHFWQSRRAKRLWPLVPKLNLGMHLFAKFHFAAIASGATAIVSWEPTRSTSCSLAEVRSQVQGNEQREDWMPLAWSS